MLDPGLLRLAQAICQYFLPYRQGRRSGHHFVGETAALEVQPPLRYTRGVVRPSTGVTSALRPASQTSILTGNSYENMCDESAGRRISINGARQVVGSLPGGAMP